jgi:Flp pilus assembly pilin Flp
MKHTGTRGASVPEYAFLTGIVAAGVIASFTAFGEQIDTSYSGFTSSLSETLPDTPEAHASVSGNSEDAGNTLDPNGSHNAGDEEIIRIWGRVGRP